MVLVSLLSKNLLLICFPYSVDLLSVSCQENLNFRERLPRSLLQLLSQAEMRTDQAKVIAGPERAQTDEQAASAGIKSYFR